MGRIVSLSFLPLLIVVVEKLSIILRLLLATDYLFETILSIGLLLWGHSKSHPKNDSTRKLFQKIPTTFLNTASGPRRPGGSLWCLNDRMVLLNSTKFSMRILIENYKT